MDLVENLRRIGKNIPLSAKVSPEAIKAFGSTCCQCFEKHHAEQKEKFKQFGINDIMGDTSQTSNNTNNAEKLIGRNLPAAMGATIATSVAAMFLGVTNPDANPVIQFFSAQMDLCRHLMENTPGIGIATAGATVAGVVGWIAGKETAIIATTLGKTIKDLPQQLRDRKVKGPLNDPNEMTM